MKPQFPRKCEPLFQNWRYKILEGGRGSGKSENIAQAFIMLGAEEPQIILCTREVQQSIRDSVHSTLKQWIGKLEFDDGTPYSDFYVAKETYIRGKNGTEFIFSGLSNIDSLKSISQVRRCWVEEGQTVRKSSWEKLIPSIRWEDRERGFHYAYGSDGEIITVPGLVSEIVVSYNPELPTDETYMRFHVNPPKSACVIQMNWRDNPWFPEVLRVEMEDLKEKNHNDYMHVYEGEPRTTVSGAIYGKEMKMATEEGRIGAVPYNRAKPVDTVWDLGFGDKTAIWFCQIYGNWYNFIDYIEGEGQIMADYLIQLQDKKYVYGTDYLPFDALDTIIHRKFAGNIQTSIASYQGKQKSIEQIMRDAGRNVRLVPKVPIADRINAGRTIFPQCRIDADKCADGIQALRHFQWSPINEKTGVSGSREPLHNWASHAAEAWTRAGQVLEMPVKDMPIPASSHGNYSSYDQIGWKV